MCKVEDGGTVGRIIIKNMPNRHPAKGDLQRAMVVITRRVYSLKCGVGEV